MKEIKLQMGLEDEAWEGKKKKKLHWVALAKIWEKAE